MRKKLLIAFGKACGKRRWKRWYWMEGVRLERYRRVRGRRPSCRGWIMRVGKVGGESEAAGQAEDL